MKKTFQKSLIAARRALWCPAVVPTTCATWPSGTGWHHINSGNWSRSPRRCVMVMKTDTEREISSDATQWGIVRPSRVMNISKENLKEFEEAEPGTPWLGFLRIGRRVGLEEDRIALIQIVQSISSGQKFVVPVKELIAGDPWHQYCRETRKQSFPLTQCSWPPG